MHLLLCAVRHALPNTMKHTIKHLDICLSCLCFSPQKAIVMCCGLGLPTQLL